MPMKNPPHPGRTIKNTCLEPLDLSVTAAAAHLGVARHTLSRLLNGQAGISPERGIHFALLTTRCWGRRIFGRTERRPSGPPVG